MNKNLKSGTCPNCDSKNIHYQKKLMGARSVIYVGFLYSHVKLTEYVCVDCGLVESYLKSNADMEKLSKSWPKLQVPDN